MSEFFVNSCDQCNKNDHDEHVIFPENGICHDCHTQPKQENNIVNDIHHCSTYCQINCNGEDCNGEDCNEDCNEECKEQCDMFGEQSQHMCDACGSSIDPTLEQVYHPSIFCPDCLIGMGEAYEKRMEIEYMENINKIATYVPLIFEKLSEIEKNTRLNNQASCEPINQESDSSSNDLNTSMDSF